jgi:hypothetical protein
MKGVEINIVSWSAWSPGLASKSSWVAWAESLEPLPTCDGRPDTPFLPAALRRRCSNLTRAALSTDVSTVFGSRHGEAQTTLSILDTLAQSGAVSPMEFSHSVHNTTSGLFTIAAGNRRPSTAIAAGNRTCEMTLLETFNAGKARDEEVLCVVADAPLPEIFKNGVESHHPFFAVAFLCSPVRGSVSLQLNLDSERNPTHSAEELLRALFTPSPESRASTACFTITGDACSVFRSVEGNGAEI